MKKKTIIISLLSVGVVTVLTVGVLLLINSFKPSAVEFVNNSDTTLYYKLGEIADITYPDAFIQREYEDGYEYATLKRDLIYGFTRLRGDDYSAVCSYMYVSKNDENDPGELFDIKIGEAVLVEQNETLGTKKRSLFDFLKENGFVENATIDYKESYVEYVDGNRCHWFCYQKDNVDLNVLVDQTGGSELRAFEIILTAYDKK